MRTQIEWRTIDGFEGLYEVSNMGRVRSIGVGNWRRKSGLLSVCFDSMGYPHVTLHGNRRLTTTVHRLVAKAFLPNPDNLPQINHINAIKSDNRVENLEWCTCKQNQKHARAKGLQTVRKGEQCWNAKLNEAAVIDMRRKHATGRFTYKDLAKEYGVSASVAGFAIKRTKWRHI